MVWLEKKIGVILPLSEFGKVALPIHGKELQIRNGLDHVSNRHSKMDSASADTTFTYNFLDLEDHSYTLGKMFSAGL